MLHGRAHISPGTVPGMPRTARHPADGQWNRYGMRIALHFPIKPFPNVSSLHAFPQCIHQCYYKAIGMFAADGKVNTDAYIKYRDELDPALRDAFTYSMVVCAKIIAKRMNNNIAEVNKMRCSPLPYLFNRCLMEVGIGNCPPERWMNCKHG